MRMIHILAWVAAVVLVMATPALAQQGGKGVGTYGARKGYDQADFRSQELTIRIGDREQTVRVSLSKVRVPGGNKTVPVELPKQGLALIQHSAGAARIATEKRESFNPLEGEWLRLPLPTELRIGSDNDTVLM